jgi:hypothetical protein
VGKLYFRGLTFVIPQFLWRSQKLLIPANCTFKATRKILIENTKNVQILHENQTIKLKIALDSDS